MTALGRLGSSSNGTRLEAGVGIGVTAPLDAIYSVLILLTLLPCEPDIYELRPLWLPCHRSVTHAHAHNDEVFADEALPAQSLSLNYCGMT